jgi:hypothetical protein
MAPWLRTEQTVPEDVQARFEYVIAESLGFRQQHFDR